jgi:predicted ATP-grasp superfamily ATP-dependent carboligase
VRAHAIAHAVAPMDADAIELPAWCRDVPREGVRFAPGDPVCTVHAAAADSRRALTLLRTRQALLGRRLRRAAA